MRMQKGQVYRMKTWEKGAWVLQYVKVLSRNATGDLLVQHYDVETGKCLRKSHYTSPIMLERSDIQLTVKREEPAKKARRAFAAKLNRTKTRTFRDACRECAYLWFAWRSPLHCQAPDPAQDGRRRWVDLVGFTKRKCPDFKAIEPQREDRA